MHLLYYLLPQTKPKEKGKNMEEVASHSVVIFNHNKEKPEGQTLFLLLLMIERDK